MDRPEITVVDCPVRDGGLMNKSQFTLETVRDVYKATCDAGIHICEIGYKNSKKHFDPGEFGPWRFCEEEILKRVTDGIETNTKLL